MNNLKVSVKILMLVVVAFIGMAVIGLRGWSSLTKAGTDMEVMYKEKLQTVNLIGEEVDSMRVIQVRTYQAIADPPRAQEVKKGQQKSIEKYEKTWAELEKLISKVPAQQALGAETKANWVRFRDSMVKTMAIAESGNSTGALAEYNASAKKETADLRDRLHKLLEMAEKNAAEINAQNDKDNEAAIMSMTAATVIAIVVLILLSVMLIKAIQSPLNAMIDGCNTLKDGDFRLSGERSTRGDEFGDAERALYDMRASVNKFMRLIAEDSEQIAASSEELTANSLETAKAATQVAESVTAAAAVVDRQQASVDNGSEKISLIATSIDEMKNQAEQAANNSATASEEAANGGGEVDSSVTQIKNVEQTVQATAELVDKLGERSKEIGTIIDTISGIAGQTNLLALNAAIEAARAGEHGRGFAVVAEEVRKLAEQSREAAEQISSLIGAIQTDTHSAVTSMQDGRTAVVEGAQSVDGLRNTFDRIKDLVDQVSGKVQTMTASVTGVAHETEGITQEMNDIDAGAKKVADEMQSVSAAAEQQSASAQEIASASDALAKLAQNMQNELKKYKY